MDRRAIRLIATLALSVIVVAGVSWGAMALWFDGPQSRVLAGAVAGGLALVIILLAAIVRPFLRGLAVALLPVAAVALWWTSIPPTNNAPERLKSSPSPDEADSASPQDMITNAKANITRCSLSANQALAALRATDKELNFWRIVPLGNEYPSDFICTEKRQNKKP